MGRAYGAMAKLKPNMIDGAEHGERDRRQPAGAWGWEGRKVWCVNQGTTARGETTRRRQSPRSSEEASNDRGAKGGRKVVAVSGRDPSRKGRRSAREGCARRGEEQPSLGPAASRPRAAAHGGSDGGSRCGTRAPMEPRRERSHARPRERPTDWKAGCLNWACPVWVGGGAATAPPIHMCARGARLSAERRLPVGLARPRTRTVLSATTRKAGGDAGAPCA